MSAARMKASFHMGSIVALSLLLVAATPADSPVADAAQRGDLEAVRTLLRDGADANGAQADGTTALHWAAMNDDVQIVDIVVRQADPHIDVLDAAARWNNKGMAGDVELRNIRRRIHRDVIAGYPAGDQVAFIRHAVGVAVIACARGNIALVGSSVCVAVTTEFCGDITLVWHAVCVAVIAGARGNIAIVGIAVLVAVLAELTVQIQAPAYEGADGAGGTVFNLQRPGAGLVEPVERGKRLVRPGRAGIVGKSKTR